MDELFSIFIEAAHNASIIPLASEATIYAMKAFDTAAMELPVAVAISGALLGMVFNWWIGKILMKLPSAPTDKPIYQKIQTYFNQYGFFLLFFAFMTLGNILVMAAGMLGTPLKKALPIVALGLVFHYGRILM